MTSNDDLASLKAKLAASIMGGAGLQRRITAIQKATAAIEAKSATDTPPTA